ncbi:tetratricopeptide repeat protein [Roseibium polysiphoniae]|uniref:Tetratricopeptide repeat protein n=1 Tax=Roseibium polysiphoniae TaxID=2571221 RepID=A0ABR9C5U1_9HYPH|nr:tetratricopeptide repeat protein [Roseibium polysiphoniae]MBD8875247.1 tetratricopeptide repeat protein [Roseibium polysiphoniae]
MSDIFREVDEDIRQEKYRRLWDRLGPWVIAAAVLIVVGTGGYRGWLYWQESQSQQAGDAFFEAVRLSESGDVALAEQKFAELSDATGGYPALAKLRAATDMVREERTTEALAEFDALSRDSSVDATLRDIASLRAAYVAVDTEDYAAVADRVEGLTGEDGPFRAAAREILAVAAWKAGDVETARSWIAALEDDPATPTDVARRVGILSQVIDAAFGAADDSDGAAQ